MFGYDKQKNLLQLQNVVLVEVKNIAKNSFDRNTCKNLTLSEGFSKLSSELWYIHVCSSQLSIHRNFFHRLLDNWFILSTNVTSTPVIFLTLRKTFAWVSSLELHRYYAFPIVVITLTGDKNRHFQKLLT